MKVKLCCLLHRITFRESNSVNGIKCLSVAMTTVTFQNGRKLTFNPIIFANEFSDPQNLPIHYLKVKKGFNVKKIRGHQTRLQNKFDLM